LEALLQARQTKGFKEGFALPWEWHSGFWKSYLKEQNDENAEVDLNNVKAARLVKDLVPLRAKVSARIEAPALPGQRRFSLEAFIYLHGVALIATTDVVSKDPAGFTLEQVIQMALLVKSGSYKVTWPDGTSESLSLAKLAEKCMDLVRTNYLGPDATKPRRTSFSDPFRVMTIIKGEGVDPAQKVEQGKAIHFALQAITQWTPDYKDTKPGDLATARIRVPPSIRYADGRIFYRDKRARVIWFPNTFIVTDSKIRSLSCYHRNIVSASMQVESLSNLVAAILARVRDKKVPTDTQKSYAHRAIVNLRLMYAGVNYTYRSRSLPLQMIDSGAVENINALQKALLLNLGDLSSTVPAPQVAATGPR
jgi:hypothetical protein